MLVANYVFAALDQVAAEVTKTYLHAREQHMQRGTRAHARLFHALISDLYDRGLQDDVAVVMWGEFGRAPRISRIAGRDHWPEAGAAVVAGGGLKLGQVIGDASGFTWSSSRTAAASVNATSGVAIANKTTADTTTLTATIVRPWARAQ